MKTQTEQGQATDGSGECSLVNHLLNSLHDAVEYLGNNAAGMYRLDKALAATLKRGREAR